ncbi:MAG: hypothetical protein IJL97_01250, partial [Lachnospiraceae bacterium]|nr:hypothetical protein [Lachnospiraceae bacterium]
MNIYMLFIMSIVILFLVCRRIASHMDIVMLICSTIMAFFAVYAVVSGLLLLADAFSTQNALTGCTVISAALLVIVSCVKAVRLHRAGADVKGQSFKSRLLPVRSTLIPVIIVVCAFPLIMNKFGYMGMGQDEGVYQTQAIALYYDHNDLEFRFDEAEGLTEAEKEEYIRSLESSLPGLYNTDPDMPFPKNDDKLSDAAGVFHGIPTFPAIL